MELADQSNRLQGGACFGGWLHHVLKPSEIAPLNAILFTDALHEAGVPKGVLNLVNGDGLTVGAAMSAHPDLDMMSFTGSIRAGILVA